MPNFLLMASPQVLPHFLFSHQGRANCASFLVDCVAQLFASSLSHGVAADLIHFLPTVAANAASFFWMASRKFCYVSG